MTKNLILLAISCFFLLGNVVYGALPNEVQNTPTFVENFNNGNNWEPRYNGGLRGKCFNDMSTVSYGYYGYQGLFLDVKGGYSDAAGKHLDSIYKSIYGYPYSVARCKTAMIQTKSSLGNFGYGYYEVIGYFKDNSGSQYAMWLSNNDGNEIDMFEIVGYLSNRNDSTSHHTVYKPNPRPNNNEDKLAYFSASSSGQWGNPRKLGFLWTENKIEAWENGVKLGQRNVSVSDFSSGSRGRIILSNEVKSWGAESSSYIPNTHHSMRIYNLKYYPLKP